MPYVLRYPGHLTIVLIMLLVAASATLVVPKALGRMVDVGFVEDNISRINETFFFMLGVAAVLAFSSACRYYFVMWMGERVVADLRKDVYSHLVTLSPHFFERTKTGEVLSRLTTDTTLIQSIVGASASVALRNLIMFVGATVMVFLTSPKHAAYFLLGIPLTVFPLIFLGRLVRKLSRKAQDTLADTSAVAGETLSAVRTVQAFGREDQEARRYDSTVEFAFGAARKRFRNQAVLTATIIMLAFSGIVGVLWSGAHDVATGSMSAGTLVQFIFYCALMAGAVGALSEVWSEVQRAAGATERLMELLGATREISAPAEPTALPKPVKGTLSFENVSFRYPMRDKLTVLDDFSLEISPGECVAIVGPSGAGKSTLFQLLLRFYDVASGVVRLDDVDVRNLDPVILREQFALVPQDPFIFSGTLADNIRYGGINATEDDLSNAMEVAVVDRFVRRLPDGLETNLGPNGVTLSGGQRQRVAIARAVLKNAPVLLLDEATSALDSESEALVQTALEGLMEGRTTLIIAHRLSTVQKADRIVVMDEGRIVEVGTHTELLAKGGLYAQLARIQFSTSGAENRKAEAELV